MSSEENTVDGRECEYDGDTREDQANGDDIANHVTLELAPLARRHLETCPLFSCKKIEHDI